MVSRDDRRRKMQSFSLEQLNAAIAVAAKKLSNMACYFCAEN